MFNKKNNIITLQKRIRTILREMAASIDRDTLQNLYDKENQNTQPDKLQLNTMSKEKWNKDILARLDRYKNVHVYVYPFSTSYNFSEILGKFRNSTNFQKFLKDNESYVSFNGGERTIFATTKSIDIFLKFLEENLEENKENVSEEFYRKFLHNIEGFKKIKKKIAAEKTKSCALVSVGSADIQYIKDIRDLNTGWMAIHKLFDAPDFISFLNKKFNIKIDSQQNNENLTRQAIEISNKIANFNIQYKTGQGKNRNSLTFTGFIPMILQQPYNLKFQKKNQKGSTYLPVFDSNEKNDFLGKDADDFKKRFARTAYLRTAKKIQDPTDEDYNSELDQDEYLSPRPVQDFLPELITYALGWFIDKNADGTYTVWDWDEDIKQGETKVMTPEEVTLRFFQKDAYDMSSELDANFVRKELIPFFEGVVLKFVINIWNYFKGKVIINFN